MIKKENEIMRLRNEIKKLHKWINMIKEHMWLKKYN